MKKDAFDEVECVELTPEPRQVQLDFLAALKYRGASLGTLILVGTVFDLPGPQNLLADRLNEIELRENRLVTDQEILREAIELMKLACPE